ncbi:MAG: polyprenyl synthetase family protein [Devosiaceae bacterium]|nr:polyprenyl synthetase family protein [Devosiaceae bacterium MH13]
MDATSRIETVLSRAVDHAQGRAAWRGGALPSAPPILAEALRYAVFPGGARVRPRLCLAVASACGDDAPELSSAAAASVELLHCASLVHDDMPCFDDASTRRGRPSVHSAYGEAIALLVGDGLIVLAFDILAQASAAAPERLAPLVSAVASCVGAPQGIVAGQAWESEATVPLEAYHRSKTGALFIGAAVAGALAAGADATPWRQLGEKLGAAYQAADDLRDALGSPEELGKPVGQDEAHHRPSLVAQCGVKETVGRLEGYVAGAIAAIPACDGRDLLEALILSEAKRLKPKALDQAAA